MLTDAEVLNSRTVLHNIAASPSVNNTQRPNILTLKTFENKDATCTEGERSGVSAPASRPRHHSTPNTHGT